MGQSPISKMLRHLFLEMFSLSLRAPALSANERIAEFLDFAIQAKFAYVNKLSRFLFCSENKKALIFAGKIKTDLVGVARFELAAS